MPILLLFLSAGMLILQIPSIQIWMQWDHHEIVTGQAWRILTGNFTHTNFYHWLMNNLALWLIVFIFRHGITKKSFLILLVALSLSTGGLTLVSSTQAYVGLSGVLHGLFAYYALSEFYRGQKKSLWLVIALISKLLWEQNFGSLLGSEAMIGTSVAFSAHISGTASGLMLAFLNYQFLHKPKH